MPVDACHNEYIENLPEWRKYRDVIAGAKKVKDGGEIYLPKIADMGSDDYIAYKQRAVFFNATGRTVESFVGMIFRKDPEFETDASLDPFKEDVTLEGESLYEFAKFIVGEVIAIGRGGTLVEWSKEEARPYFAHYPAEQIINWRAQRVNGKTTVSMIVLHELVLESEALQVADGKETADQSENDTQRNPIKAGVVDHSSYTGGVESSGGNQSDDFTPRMINQIRVLKLVPPQSGQGDWVYQVEIWQKEKSEKKTNYVLISTITPERKGQTIPEIPFVFHNANNLLPQVDKSPMADIVEMNLAHYRTSADLEHGRHYTALPTPYVFGIDSKTVIKLGSRTAIVSDNPQCNAGFLEFTGTGLTSLEKSLEEKEHQMSVLGARMLEAPKRAAETVEVLQMKQTGEQSSLAQIAATSSCALQRLLRWAYFWIAPANMNFSDTEQKAKVELNTEFNPTDINPNLVNAIGAAQSQGLLSRESAVWALKKGELVNPTRSVEEEIALIDAEMKLKGTPIPLKDDPKNQPPKP